MEHFRSFPAWFATIFNNSFGTGKKSHFPENPDVNLDISQLSHFFHQFNYGVISGLKLTSIDLNFGNVASYSKNSRFRYLMKNHNLPKIVISSGHLHIRLPGVFLGRQRLEFIFGKAFLFVGKDITWKVSNCLRFSRIKGITENFL